MASTRLLASVHCVILVVLVAIGGISSVSATPTIDGKYDPTEGYTTGYALDFKVEGSSTLVSGGQLWLHEAVNGDVSVAFIQPLSLVDNSYGATAIGWGASAPSGKSHKFQDLTGSDKAQFELRDANDDVVLDITIDYLHGLGDKKEDPPFVSGGVTLGDGRVNVGLATDVIAANTSLAYNWKQYKDSNPEYFGKDSDSPSADSDYTNSVAPEWIYEVVYEFQISGTVFAASGFGNISIPVVHDSPNKIGKNKVWPTLGDPLSKPVPEPSTLLLLGSGLVGFVAYRKRRAA